jgi:hypothetical protein
LEKRLALTNHVLIHADHHGSNAFLLTNWTEPTKEYIVYMSINKKIKFYEHTYFIDFVIDHLHSP